MIIPTVREVYNLLVKYQNYGNSNKRMTAQGRINEVTFIADGKSTKLDGKLLKYPHFKVGSYMYLWYWRVLTPQVILKELGHKFYIKLARKHLIFPTMHRNYTMEHPFQVILPLE